MEPGFEYITAMFPYPSGDGLHIGHFYNYAITDSYCRYRRHIGKKVFQPFGYDAFGLPAENYALKIGGNPKDVTTANIERFRVQMQNMNTGFEELLVTSSVQYQFYTQWLFTEMYKRGLAYKAYGEQDFCPSCNTVLAREQVIIGKCERCESQTVKKKLHQWYFRITDYTQRLADGLSKVDYPQKTVKAQLNWLKNQHDWCVSRQRKWGCPIPIDGETDTLDTFVDSSIYTIVYCIFKGIKPIPVDLYVGGSEHACMHLIYARFVTMFLKDIGFIDFEEPFKKVIHQGMILNNGEKMSKSKGNVINPDNYNPRELRFYLMFLGHYFDGGVWNDQNIKGVQRFFERWESWMKQGPGSDVVNYNAFESRIFSFTDQFKFNRVVSEFMIFLKANFNKRISADQKYKLQQLLNIYAPC